MHYHDFYELALVIEGTGHAGVGSCFDLSNARVAQMFGAKVVILTTGGIGRAIALRFAAEGARVVVDDIDDDAGHATVDAIARAGGQACYVHADVADPAADHSNGESHHLTVELCDKAYGVRALQEGGDLLLIKRLRIKTFNFNLM